MHRYNKTVSSEVTSALNVEDIENEGTNNENSSETIQKNFIEPDETEADKILEEKKNASSSIVSSNTSNTSSLAKTEPSRDNSSEDKTNESSEPTDSSTGPQSFEEGQDALKNKTLEYLKEHNIDPKTAGETGENCPHCGKKLWNPDKYGAFIPGMPDDYENSGYCLGTCAISFE